MNTEIWLPVVGWEGIYEVSNIGRVKRIARSKGTRPNRILTNTDLGTGYLVVRLRYKGRVGQPTVHTLVMAAFVGPRPAGLEINHKDGNPGNPRLDNLEYVTRSENICHSYAVLHRPKSCNKGEAAGRAKVTNEDVLSIRSRYAAGGISQQKLADEFGLSQPVVSCIIRRVNWTHI